MKPEGKIRHKASFALALLLLSCPTSVPAQENPKQDSNESTILNAHVIFHGNVNPKALPHYDLGRVEPSLHLYGITFQFSRTPAQHGALKELLAEQRDPSHPNYRKWLTPEQYADRVGLSQNQMEVVTKWLAAQGFHVQYIARGRDYITFDGTAETIQKAFGTEIHRYNVEGEEHYANASEPSLPAPIADMVTAVMGLDDFYPKPMNLQSQDVTSGLITPFLTNGNQHYLAPDDIATIYDIISIYNAGYNASGQSIVVVGASDISTQDLSDFLTIFNLPSFTLQQILYPGSLDPGSNNALTEADLDLEWVSATARGANVIYVYGTNVDLAKQYAIDQGLAPVLSESFGGCEEKFSSSYLSALEMQAQKANAEGITWLASSGDSGAADCDHDQIIATQGLTVNVPASVPEVTAVGGTEFNEGNGTYWSASNSVTGESALSYIPEVTWNDTASQDRLAASGGGVSSFYPKPVWQVGTGVPNDGRRDLPDLSFTASAVHDGYLICTQNNCTNGIPLSGIGGTSASTPVFAGIVVLLNKYLLAQGTISQAGLGNINPTLYGLAQIPFNPPIFHDVTIGNNDVPCQAGTVNCPSGGSIGYNAGPGYDLVTGLGSVDAGYLVGTWPGPARQLSLTAPSNTVAGTLVNITLRVLDIHGRAALGYLGTVRFASSDSQAVLPGNFHFHDGRRRLRNLFSHSQNERRSERNGYRC